MFTIQGKYTTATVMIDNIDEETTKQIQSMVNHPAATNPVAIMCDTHKGKGCVIGFTMKTGSKIVPNWIGVDISCSVLSIQTNINVSETNNDIFANLDKQIRRSIPMGMNIHHKYSKEMCQTFVKFLKDEAEKCPVVDGFKYCRETIESLEEKLKRVGMRVDRFWQSIGTLGGGNHFCEVGKDEHDNLWITIHTGSRNFGKVVCEYFNKIGIKNLDNPDISCYIKELKERVKAGEILPQEINGLIEKKKQENKQEFDVKESAYIEGKDLEDYISYMFLAQVYAKFNRKTIMDEIINQFQRALGKTIEIKQEIECIHNYISFDDFIIRKGAIQSYIGKKMIIPFNMRDGMIICEGKANPDWNFSAPHGAGRISSRKKAKENISFPEYQESMEGIFSTSVCESTIDESPMAYKDSELIKQTIEPTATILYNVKPIYNLKASE